MKCNTKSTQRVDFVCSLKYPDCNLGIPIWLFNQFYLPSFVRIIFDNSPKCGGDFSVRPTCNK